MSRDPFRGYDAWLEAPIQRMYAEQEAELEAWEEFCEEQNGPDTVDVPTIVGLRPVAVTRTPVVPVEAAAPDHPDHAIYTAWLALHGAITRRWDRIQGESEAAYWAAHQEEDLEQ